MSTPALPTSRALYTSASGAPEPRTLTDVLAATAGGHPDAPALDDGRSVLTYRQLTRAAERTARDLRAAGIGRGDRVGIRVPSGTNALYVAILGTLLAGAAYVPVDADDPEERAALVFTEAAVTAVLTPELTRPEGAEARPPRPREKPGLADDAWIIFTSGSTGRPKGVAVSHRGAAAFVDAEAALFLRDEPIGPGDRVLAGLSVAFDASCEEMWLAWRYGACLVPAPRALVRAGTDLGPWLLDKAVTVVSTVPTLAALWPAESLEGVRLLIFGGEACPLELAARLARPGREVWNTYGPTEATVVACAAPLTATAPVRIGLPLDGWELAVVDPSGELVGPGEQGELVIGGVGLARYLDPAKDAEKYAPMPSLGWERAYRSGDMVRADPEGLVFLGRADDQIKIGGRRIELGEIDAALLALPDVKGAAAAVRTTPAGHKLLVGYLVARPGLDLAEARDLLRQELPAALVPRLALVDELPTRTSGKVDRDALPWPLVLTEVRAEDLTDDEQWLADRWEAVLGASPAGPDDDFFALGGSSLAAARLVTALRERYPAVTVAELYDHPGLRDMAAHLPSGSVSTSEHVVGRVPRTMAVLQTVLMLPLLTLGAVRWGVALAALAHLLPWAPHLSWWFIGAGLVVFVNPFGRMVVSALAARLLLRGVEPGGHPRGGAVHLRLWLAEQLAARLGAAELSGAPWLGHYARMLGADVAHDADLHSIPPVTGLLRVGPGAAVEPEVDLAGHWIDGDVLRIGEIRIDAGARVGVRSTLMPGARIGRKAQVSPGTMVAGTVPAGQSWAGAPAARSEASRRWRPEESARRSRLWITVYAATALGLGLLPVVAMLPGLAVLSLFLPAAPVLLDRATALGLLAGVPAAACTVLVAYAFLTWASVRLLARGLGAGRYPVHSRVAWQAWTTVRLMAMARVWLFPLYSSSLTPSWLRALGAGVGRDVEASTVLAIPALTTVADGAFLADDTMIAPYELNGGWMMLARAKIGKRAFLGNSGMAAPGRKIPKGGLIGVLSATPRDAGKGASYVGLPPVELYRESAKGDRSRTYAPSRAVRTARVLVEVCRLVPVMITAGLAVAFAVFFLWTAGTSGFLAAFALAGAGLLAAGILGALTAVAAKWLLVGRISAGEKPLWSSFVWRNELADTFVEIVAAPWFATAWLGTAPLNWWLRAMGARIGRGVWCETYWLPEADLVHLGYGATVNRGCVLQTHLFHDRVLSMDTVSLMDGATLGPNGVVLPAASLGENASVGPASLVLRGESVPGHTRWSGNPIVAAKE
ncbi:Pls/PosA family non-ribosomal peptide synthetase [Actinocorallia longicatena]|uniref:Non-ribosomal peptide synthetase n=1 Tax=Actinocorallia longicatena TaxID=111803 RepID=A0ABP6QAE4_9ACTN